MRFLMLITAVAGLASPPPAIHGFMDSAALMATCKPQDPQASAAPARAAVCLGYVAGVIDALMLDQSDRDPEARTICPSSTLTVNAARDAVVERAGWAINARPVGAAGFIEAALEDAFPCGHGAAAPEGRAR